MSRVAVIVASIAVLSSTVAQARGMLDVLDGDCRSPRVYLAPFREQVCTRGPAGYASCRWISRSHAVEAPADCGPRATIETARPATRGAFPRG